MCRAKSGRRDLMGSQRVARPSLERGMEAANGKKRTPQHEGVTEGRGGNGRKPPPPHTMCHTPHWASAGRVAFYYFTHPTGHPQGGLLSITLHTPLGIRRAGCFLLLYTPHWASAGRVAFYYFVFLKRRKCIRGHFLVVFGIRSGPSQGFSRIRRGIRRHPRVRWQLCESNGWFSGPCLATLLPRLIEIARACNHSS